MSIKRIRISNFKSFKNLEIELSNFNVLIGANAAGKSNFIQIFKFLKDITNEGLDNAISLQGGVEYLRNINIGRLENFSIEVVSVRQYMRTAVRREKEVIRMRTHETIFNLAMKFNMRGPGFKIIDNRLTQKFDLIRFIRQQSGKLEEKENLGPGEIVFSSVKGEITVDFSKFPEGVLIAKDDLFSPFFRDERLPRRALLIEYQFPFLFPEDTFGDTSIYDFDPKLPKRATPITGKADLEEDGSNLAIVLKNIIGTKEQKRKLYNLVTDLLPFVKGLDVKRFEDKSLLFTLQETYAPERYLPASSLSDGTINMAALIIALYFEKNSLTIIEEPERNIHPHLISKVVDMMKDASRNKQVIVTTHNPEVVKHAGLENILLISRDEEGFSFISKPHEKEAIKTFLKNDLGIEELYVQNLLELEA